EVWNSRNGGEEKEGRGDAVDRLVAAVREIVRRTSARENAGVYEDGEGHARNQHAAAVTADGSGERVADRRFDGRLARREHAAPATDRDQFELRREAGTDCDGVQGHSGWSNLCGAIYGRLSGGRVDPDDRELRLRVFGRRRVIDGMNKIFRMCRMGSCYS